MANSKPMTQSEFEALDTGDVVRGVGAPDGMVVMANYGDRVTVVQAAELTNPREWILVSKADGVDD